MTRFRDASVQKFGYRWNWRSQNSVWLQQELQHPERKNSTLGVACAWWRLTTPMTTGPPRPRAPLTQSTWTLTREVNVRALLSLVCFVGQVLVVMICTPHRGSSFTCARHLMVITWWTYLFDLESSIHLYFLSFSFIFNLLRFLLHFFHYFEGSSNTAYFAWKEMDSLDDSHLLTQEETEWQEQSAREAAWKLATSVLELKEKNRATFFSPQEN